MADINAIALQFTEFYYQAFDSNRAGLHSLYVRRHVPHLGRPTSGSDLFSSAIHLCSLLREPLSKVLAP